MNKCQHGAVGFCELCKVIERFGGEKPVSNCCGAELTGLSGQMCSKCWKICEEKPLPVAPQTCGHNILSAPEMNQPREGV